jgi:glycosyltransferase involved in cell wall biosynthesis
MAATCRRLQADLYFGPNGVYHSSLRLPQCLLVQDPTPYVIPPPDAVNRVRATLLRRSWGRGVVRAACMGYTSNYMRSLVRRSASGRCERRFLIAYNGINERMREIAQVPCLGRAERAPFILAVSGYMLHKNFETLIRALAILRQDPDFRNYSLRIIGHNIRVSGHVAKTSNEYISRLEREIREQGLNGAVSLEYDQPWSVLADAYRSASVFALTSLCESFGIPAIEAMAYGTPTVLGECCAVPEVGGDAALYVTPRDAPAVAAAWRRLLTEPELYARLQEAGRVRCLRFSWADTVSQWIGVFEELVDRKRHERPSAEREG